MSIMCLIFGDYLQKVHFTYMQLFHKDHDDYISDLQADKPKLLDKVGLCI